MSTSIDRQLEEFILKYDFTIPDRELKELETTDVTWRDGKPDYRGVDLAYFKGKSKNHPVGSLEITVGEEMGDGGDTLHECRRFEV